MDLNDLLSGLMTDMRKVSDTASLMGKPAKVGDSHMVPLLDVSIAFGAAATDLSGNGEQRGARADGAGAGGTMVVTPKAFVVVGGDGVAQLVVLKDGKYGSVRKAIVLELNEQEGAPGATTPKLPAGGGSNR